MSVLVQRLHVYVILVGDDSPVVALDRRIDDGTVARSVDVDSVEDIGAARRSVGNGV